MLSSFLASSSSLVLLRPDAPMATTRPRLVTTAIVPPRWPVTSSTHSTLTLSVSHPTTDPADRFPSFNPFGNWSSKPWKPKSITLIFSTPPPPASTTTHGMAAPLRHPYRPPPPTPPTSLSTQIWLGSALAPAMEE